MNFKTLSKIILFALLLSGATPALAQAQLPERLEEALVNLEMGRDQISRFSFERETFKGGAKAEVKLFDPEQIISERWRIQFPSQAENPKEYAKLKEKYEETEGNSDVELVVPNLRSRIASGATALREEPTLEIFSFDIADEYMLEGGGLTSDIAKHIKGEIAVDKNNNTIRWIRYYAPKEFNPIAIVRLVKYEIVQHLAPAWHGGPLVRVYETSKVNGRAPFVRINVDEIMINRNFAPINAE